MSRSLSASDRSALIRLASSMEKGSDGRRAILSGLKMAGATPTKQEQRIIDWLGEMPLNLGQAASPISLSILRMSEADFRRVIEKMVRKDWVTTGIDSFGQTLVYKTRHTPPMRKIPSQWMRGDGRHASTIAGYQDLYQGLFPMSRALTASDRSSLIRLASSLPVGSTERKAILAGLGEGTTRFASSENALTRYATKLAEGVAKRNGGHLTQSIDLVSSFNSPSVKVYILAPYLKSLFEMGDMEMGAEGEAEAQNIANGLAKAFGVSMSSVDWEAQDQIGYVFTVDVGT